MVFNEFIKQGPHEKRFEKNESVEKILANKKYRKQPMFVDMGRQRNTDMDDRNVYDHENPVRRYPVKCPDIAPQY